MLLKKLKNLAYPWRGYIQDGLLHLPNGSTRPAHQVLDGDTLLQRLPWAPGADLTPEETALDDAEGMQRPDYFLLSTSDHAVYGSDPLGQLAWVYGAPDGTAWKVEIVGIGPGQASWSGLVRATRYGAIGESPLTFDAPFSLSDRGQASPALPTEYIGVYGSSDPGVRIPRSRGLRLFDISADGSRAVFGEIQDGVRAPNFRSGIDYIPNGFWLAEITGTPGVDFVAKVSTLYTREETLGDLSDTGPLEPHPSISWSAGNAVIASPSGGLTDNQWVTLEAVPADPERDAVPQSGVGFRYDQVFPGNDERTVRVVGQVIAVWFDPVTGEPAPVTADTELIWKDQRPEPTQTAAGSITGRFIEGAPAGIIDKSGSLTWTFEHSASLHREFRITLRFKGSSISSFIREELEYQHSASYSGDLVPRYVDGEYRAAVYVLETSKTETAVKTVTTPAGSNTEDIAFYPMPGRQDTRYPWGMSATRQLYLIEPIDFFTSSVWQNSSQSELGVLRYSNNLLSLMARTGPPAAWDTWHAGLCLTPGGVAGEALTTPSNRLYGSWHPVTKALIRGEQTPVCWV